MCPVLESKELMESLRKENKEFRNLEEKHKEYEARLDQFKKRLFLTPNQEFSEQEIKKKKLLIKDRMAEIIRDFLGHKNPDNGEASPDGQLS